MALPLPQTRSRTAVLFSVITASIKPLVDDAIVNGLFVLVAAAALISVETLLLLACWKRPPSVPSSDASVVASSFLFRLAFSSSLGYDGTRKEAIVDCPSCLKETGQGATSSSKIHPNILESTRSGAPSWQSHLPRYAVTQHKSTRRFTV
jgi:hypothetical protein